MHRRNGIAVDLLLVGTVMFLGTVAFAPSSFADTPEEERVQAEALNAEGKQLINDLNLEGAAEKFREAIRLVEDRRYAFNLCFTLEKSNVLEEAQRACRWVTTSEDERLAAKAAALLKIVDAKLAKAGPVSTSPPTVTQPPLTTPGLPPPSTSPPQPPPKGFPPPGVTNAPPKPPMPMAEPPKPTLQFGLRLGFANSNLARSDFSESGIGGGVLGITMGQRMDQPIQIISELQIVSRGGSTEIRDGGFNDLKLDLLYLDLSSAGRYVFGSGKTTFYAELGATASVLLDSSVSSFFLDDDEVPDPDIASSDFSVDVGVGASFKAWDIRVRYMHGLASIAEFGSRKRESDTVHNRSTLLEVGYWL